MLCSILPHSYGTILSETAWNVRPRYGPAYLKNSLIDPRFDFDSCGVGFVAQLSDELSHEILQHALMALSRLEHRGAVVADGKSSDGAWALLS